VEAAVQDPAPPRSWLFVPGDSEAKLAKVAGYGADVVVVDLEDAVAPEAKSAARHLAQGWLTAGREQSDRGQRWVRINSLETSHWRDDLAAIMPGRPDGILLPKALGPELLQLLAAELYQLEQRHGTPPGTTRIVPMVGETPASALTISAYLDSAQTRLAGLTWGAEDLAGALGARRKRDSSGQWCDAFRFVRSQVLLTAHARRIMAIDTLHADFRDLDALVRIAAGAFADGFTGMLAIHPAQVAVINAAFSPNPAELAEAHAIVAAFDAQPGAGTVALEGRMLDQPHLSEARRRLDRLA
jgi:citrate lyase subunit beta/citryl-CoA lyase